MRKSMLRLLVFLTLLACACAANEPMVQPTPTPGQARIAELRARQQQIVLEVNDRQIIIAQHQQAISALQIELYKAQGAVEELERQERQKQNETKEDSKK